MATSKAVHFIMKHQEKYLYAREDREADVALKKSEVLLPRGKFIKIALQ